MKGPDSSNTPLPLDGIRVTDAASLLAGPLIATTLGDFGADVIKVEHPRGDDARRWGGPAPAHESLKRVSCQDESSQRSR